MGSASSMAGVAASRCQAVSGRWVTPRGLAAAAPELQVSIPGASRTRDRGDALVFYPALVNAHDHLHLNGLMLPALGRTFRSSYYWIAALLPLHDSPAGAAYRSLPRSVRVWQGALKNLVAGTTTVLHHDPWQAEFDNPQFPVDVPSNYSWAHSPLLAGLVHAANAGAATHPLPPEMRYGPSIAESFPSSASRPWIIHAAEGTDAESLMEFHALDRAGCVTADTVLVHGVGLDAAAQDRVLQTGAHLVWCPASNLALLGKTLDPERLARAGHLSLGTDSRLSGSRDLLRELRIAARCSRLIAEELFDLVTVNTARAARLAESRFLPGAGDYFIATDRGGNAYAQLLELERCDIRAVVRRGKPAIADPDFAPWFADAAIDTCPVVLDGKLKLCAAALLEPFLAAGAPDLTGLDSGMEVLPC